MISGLLTLRVQRIEIVLRHLIRPQQKLRHRRHPKIKHNCFHSVNSGNDDDHTQRNTDHKEPVLVEVVEPEGVKS
jgi:hypothetical protein